VRLIYACRIYSIADVVYPARFLAVAGGATPTKPYFYLEEKKMKKVFLLMIVAGLSISVFLSSPVKSEGGKKGIGTEQAKFRKNANKIENNYIVVLNDDVVGERGRFSIAPYFVF